MLRSFRSRPSVQRFLAAPGPSILYTVLAGLCAWGAVAAGWHSPGAAVCGLFALLFGLVAAQEVHYGVTDSGPP